MVNQYIQWKNKMKAEKMAEALKKREFNVHLVRDLKEAKKLALSMIPDGSTVAVGGSVTLSQMNMIDTLREGPYAFFDRYQDLPFEPDIVEIYRDSLTADILLTSVNAVTEKGELVCSDSTGNRIAGLVFGAKKVIAIIGANKLVKDISRAFEHIEDTRSIKC